MSFGVFRIKNKGYHFSAFVGWSGSNLHKAWIRQSILIPILRGLTLLVHGQHTPPIS
jgi:hypothetical protein